MAANWVGMLRAERGQLIRETVSRLAGRPAFLPEAEALAGLVERCVDALALALDGASRALVEEALAIARADPDPGRGYRRAQLLLEGVCEVTVAWLRQTLGREPSRAAARRLRDLFGPAQLALATVVRTGLPTEQAGLTTTLAGHSSSPCR